MGTSVHIPVAIVLVLACVTDLRARRIPNTLTLTAVVAALAFHLATGGPMAVAMSATGCLVGALLFFPMFALRGMGAGDVKLLAAVGAWIGPGPVAITALVTSIVGGLLALIVALGFGYLRTALANVWLLLTHWRVNGVRALPSVSLSGHSGPRLAYAFPIAIGTMVTLWLR